jgi:RsiW-degrading membrane proteinase PrsW (M82 family)
MNLITIFILAYAPSLALLWYFYHKDKYEPEPKKYVIITFFYGALNSVIIAIFLETLIMSFIPSTALTIALVAALIEEPAKAYVIRVPYNAGQMNGIMDGVVYGVAAGLGFAATENLFFGLGFGVGITLIRALLTPIAHGVWSATIGVGFGLKAEGRNGLLFFFLIAIMLHFLWDYAVFMSEKNLLYFSFVIWLIIVNAVLISYFVKTGLEEDRQKYRLT